MPEQHSSSLPRHLAPTFRQPNSLNGSGFFLRLFRLRCFAPAASAPWRAVKLSSPAARRDKTNRRAETSARERVRASKPDPSMRNLRDAGEDGVTKRMEAD